MTQSCHMVLMTLRLKGVSRTYNERRDQTNEDPSLFIHLTLSREMFTLQHEMSHYESGVCNTLLVLLGL